MEPFRLPPWYGASETTRRTVKQLWDSIMPQDRHTIRTPALFQAAASWQHTKSFLRDLETSFQVRDTIDEFMLMIFVTPVRQGRDVPGFMELVTEAAARGLPLIMIPGKDLLADVVTAESYAEGAAVLFAARDEIAPRCRVMLKGDLPRDFAPAALETLERVQPVAVEAAELFAGGHYVGAQAVSTAALDTLLAKVLGGHMDALGGTKHHGFGATPSIKKVLALMDASSPEHKDRALALKLIIPPAINAFQEATADMDEYNRHATIHRVSTRQYTPENALIALMHMSAIFVLLRCVGPGGLPPGPTQAV